MATGSDFTYAKTPVVPEGFVGPRTFELSPQTIKDILSSPTTVLADAPSGSQPGVSSSLPSMRLNFSGLQGLQLPNVTTPFTYPLTDNFQIRPGTSVPRADEPSIFLNPAFYGVTGGTGGKVDVETPINELMSPEDIVGQKATESGTGYDIASVYKDLTNGAYSEDYLRNLYNGATRGVLGAQDFIAMDTLLSGLNREVSWRETRIAQFEARLKNNQTLTQEEMAELQNLYGEKAVLDAEFANVDALRNMLSDANNKQQATRDALASASAASYAASSAASADQKTAEQRAQDSRNAIQLLGTLFPEISIPKELLDAGLPESVVNSIFSLALQRQLAESEPAQTRRLSVAVR